jgi:hypothetical protein
VIRRLLAFTLLLGLAWTGGTGAALAAADLGYSIGDAVIGRASNGTSILYIGPLYGGGVKQAGPVITGDPDDNGLVQQTTIKRDGDNAGATITLTWVVAPGVSAVDIWRLAGAGAQFDPAATGWAKVKANVTAFTWTDDVSGAVLKVGDGINAYYRVVPTGTAQADVFLPANNARTVGKVDVDFPKGYTLFEAPVWTTDMTLSTAIGNQLDKTAGGDELYDFSMNKATYADGSWVGTNVNFEHGRGYYLRILNTAKKVTFVGLVALADVNLSLNPSYSMVGNPYPLIKEVSDIFTNVSVGEELYDKFANKKTYTADGWVGATYSFGIGDGFWFRRTGTTAYNWQLRP